MTRKKAKSAALAITYRPIEALRADPRNSNTHPEKQLNELRVSIREFGINKPILLKDDFQTIGAGHGIWKAAKLEGYKEVPTITIEGLSEEKWRAYAIADNRIARNSEWDFGVLAAELRDLQGIGFSLTDLGFSAPELSDMGFVEFFEPPAPPSVKLSDKFGIAPFSVLNAREGWWQARKAAWLVLGIQSEVGRGDNLLKMSDTMLEPDPVKRAARKKKAAANAEK